MSEMAYHRLSSAANPMFVVVAGNIGSGKTTLTKKLSERLGWKPHFESVQDNPYLSDFYADMSRWSFPLQVYFLNHRFNTHREIEALPASSVQDRSIYEDANIFARSLHEQGKLDDRDYNNYRTLYDSMIQFLSPPTLMIFLRRSVPKLQERIKQRGRDYEQAIPVEYLTSLNKYYDDWYNNYNLGKSLIVDTDELDFLDNEEHFDRLVKRIWDSIDQKDMFFYF
ncbi:deoxynucleoside kinase [Peredibacter starrii]|uniref:Deoxynucleoside kinase n=1 Tax=Peredibacter starrii TaxID=28202 RepID=A0AAX4HQV2_9BACT|nr:deoxynucleoside kinase [Peredibacter starrii]WPU65334.1 deoxynucleoside kinase [Peredibacter starrii]